MTSTYSISVFFSPEDGAWIADVPDLAYCSALGDTPHEAVQQVETAIEVWIEAAREAGREVPPPSSRAIGA